VADVTQLLIDWSNGDREGVEQLAPLVYDELRRTARRLFGRERRKDHTLRPTAVVNEVWVKLIDQTRLKLDVNLKPREYFMRLVARMMRNVLVDYAVARGAQKRPEGRVKVSLDQPTASGRIGQAGVANILGDKVDESIAAGGKAGIEEEEIVSVHQLLERLEKFDPLLAEILDQRIVLGCTIEETANNLGLGTATVKRRAAEAYAWLRREMARDGRSLNGSGAVAPDPGNI
jgi:RNA polymerase sigma factor (TIGR02999 family)